MLVAGEGPDEEGGAVAQIVAARKDTREANVGYATRIPESVMSPSWASSARPKKSSRKRIWARLRLEEKITIFP
jgi:hypothetical protein